MALHSVICSTQHWFRDSVFVWICDSAAKIMAHGTGKRPQCHALLMYVLPVEQQGIMRGKSIIWTLCSVHEIWQVWVMGSDTEKFLHPSEGLSGTQEGKGFWCQQNQPLSEWGKEVRGYSELAAKVSSDTWMLLGVLLSREQLPESLRPHKLNRQKIKCHRKSEGCRPPSPKNDLGAVLNASKSAPVFFTIICKLI